jgi:hypothetical protein
MKTKEDCGKLRNIAGMYMKTNEIQAESRNLIENTCS